MGASLNVFRIRQILVAIPLPVGFVCPGVDTLRLSYFASTTHRFCKSGRGSIFSPLPVARAVPPEIQNGTSDPSVAPICCNSGTVKPSFHNRLTPTNTAAASVEPPAKPAATGIFFSMVISIPPPGYWRWDILVASSGPLYMLN